jgi:parallel beta-helix repeat protein
VFDVTCFASKCIPFLVLVVTLFFPVLTTGFVDAEVNPFNYVYINDDGTTEPSDAPIHHVGNVYTLLSDLDAVSVLKNDTILDGNGHSVTGQGRTMAIYVGATNVTVMNFVLFGCQVGIWLNMSANATVVNNTITDTTAAIPPAQTTGAIYIWGGGSHVITGNRIENNYGGIGFGFTSSSCLVVGNNITGNTYGVGIWNSSNNVFHHNNFTNNTLNVNDWSSTSTNIWDNGKEGNYWSDYNQTNNNTHGVWDTQYIIDNKNQDNYPLVSPVRDYIIPEFQLWPFLPILAVATAFTVFYKRKLPKKPN